MLAGGAILTLAAMLRYEAWILARCGRRGGCGAAATRARPSCSRFSSRGFRSRGPSAMRAAATRSMGFRAALQEPSAGAGFGLADAMAYLADLTARELDAARGHAGDRRRARSDSRASDDARAAARARRRRHRLVLLLRFAMVAARRGTATSRSRLLLNCRSRQPARALPRRTRVFRPSGCRSRCCCGCSFPTSGSAPAAPAAQGAARAGRGDRALARRGSVARHDADRQHDGRLGALVPAAARPSVFPRLWVVRAGGSPTTTSTGTSKRAARVRFCSRPATATQPTMHRLRPRSGRAHGRQPVFRSGPLRIHQCRCRRAVRDANALAWPRAP